MPIASAEIFQSGGHEAAESLPVAYRVMHELLSKMNEHRCELSDKSISNICNLQETRYQDALGSLPSHSSVISPRQAS